MKELAGIIAPGEGSGSRFSLRADIGRREHQKRQNVIRGKHPDFEGEYQVSHTFDLNGWSVTVRGRPDAVYREGEALVVEEIKTVAAGSGEFAGFNPDSLLFFKAQLDLYCYLLSLADTTVISGRLYLINIAAAGERSFDFTPDYGRTALALEQALSRLLAEAERRRQHHLNLRRAAGELRFPHPEMRAHQGRMVEAVGGAVESGKPLMLSASTGSGKTAGALFPALTGAFKQGLQVFFATSRTTQRHIVREFAELLKRQEAPFSALFLTARAKMCPLNLERCQPEECAYLADFQSKFDRCTLPEELDGGAVLEAEEIAGRVLPLTLCPFFVSLKLAEEADLTVGDYNYVFDPSARLRGLFDEGGAKDYILIVDEAHGLPVRVRERYSPELLAPAVMELLASLKAKNYADPLFKEIARFLRAVLKFLRRCSEPDFFESDISLGELGELYQTTQRLTMGLCLEAARFGSNPAENPVFAFLKEFEWFCKVAEMGPKGFSPIYQREARSLKIACLDTAPVLREAMAQFHSVIAMSATLHPAEFFRNQLGFEEAAEYLELPYPFPQENRFIAIVPSVSTRYHLRSRFHSQIAEIVDRVYRAHPGGYFCFFPSFAYIEAVERHLESPHIVQRAEMSEEERNGFLAEVAAGGKVFLAVMGGIFAEGVDYPRQLQGVMVVGPGLPLYCAETELQRRHFDQQCDAGFEYAYAYPGMNRVVQAAGRLIRSGRDRGAVILIGARFAQEPYRSLLPRDWYVEHPGELVVNDLEGALRRFWGRG